MKKYLNGKLNFIAIVFLFIFILTCSRLLWIITFHNSNQPDAVNGVLDLRKWDFNHTVDLDGQWEFFPNTWLINKKDSRKLDINPKYIQVPGSWNTVLNNGKNTPYGYGSYRLRILVNPNNNLNFSIRIPSIRSSSELYVNGHLLGKSGQPGKNKREYVAYNVPYSSTFTKNGKNLIEVVIQAANFKDPRDSGIIRSIKFGSEAAISKESQLSTNMQQMVAIVFLLHSIYSLILFFIGNREKRLLYFSLVTFNAMILYLLGSNEKLLSFWFPINYEWGFKLVHVTMVITAYSLLQCIRLHFTEFWNKVFPLYTAYCGILLLLALIFPTRNIVTIQPLYLFSLGVSVFLTIVLMFRTSIRGIKENKLLLFSIIAFTNNLMWWGIDMTLGIKVIYYPFDLIVSIACISSVWFKNYFQIHVKTKQLALKLQRVDQLKDEFLANTSHELRNPLHSILNISQSILEREKPVLKEKSVEDLENVLFIGRSMSLMLTDLLDVMSLKEGIHRLNYKSISMNPIVIGVLDMLYYSLDGKPVQLINDISEDFPKVYADENRVIQILYNLLHNAIKYTNEGVISVKGKVKDRMAYITIKDTGIGMDKETLQRVFEPYEKADPRITMVEGGIGLGLSISKQLVELQGGTITVTSIPGQGSEFVFTLQLSTQKLSQEDSESVISPLREIVQSITVERAYLDDKEEDRHILADRPKILVVDDDPLNLDVIESILSREQYDMMKVLSGEKALSALNINEWDLVISDVMMPQMSGYELSRLIRKRYSITELPILLITARGQVEDIKNGFLSGANDYLTKPINAMELRSRVKALTDVKKSVKERLKLETAWLQAQIQPHFLFNTLNSIVALSEIDIDRMRSLLMAFSDFLNNKIQIHHFEDLIPLEDELNLVRCYLYIEQERFGERLQVNWEVCETNHLVIPPLTIQPIVENAVAHGIMKRVEGGNIHIKIINKENYVEISIIDDGVGMNEAAIKQIQQGKTDTSLGIGLVNTDLRLKRFYGKGLHIESKLGFGTSISFVIHKTND